MRIGVARFRWPGAACLLLASLCCGCAATRTTVRPLSYELDVRLDPSTHTLAARAALELEQLPPESPERGRHMTIELQLHPDLEVRSIEVRGATLRSHRRRAGPPQETPGAVAPATHRLVLVGTGGQLAVTLDYRGRLQQDLAAGELEGEVHNFAVTAHVGAEGIYLGEKGYWYPVVELPRDGDPALGLADYRLVADPIEGFELVAGLEREAGPADGRLHWRSPFPMERAVLLGGPLRRWSRTHGQTELAAVLPADKAAVAADLLDASAEYLDRYEPLIGPYPFREFTVLEAFFSSGFAFPTCTQIAGSQLSEHRQYRRHGYLDHELLHNWWGNGVLVDPRDGNWCEGLASYLGNYYGHVLDGDDEGARRQRRNYSNFLSALEPEEDRPLGTFGRDGGASRGVGYQKGAAVFHMLERKIGSEALFAGLQRLAAERMGRFASWADLERAIEEESGVELDRFFEQWVRRAGAPTLALRSAEWTPGSERLGVVLSQGATDFALDVPLRLHYVDRTEDVVAHLDASEARVELACDPAGLLAVELDPDYHVFRKLESEETMPTASLTRRGPRLLVVVPQGELPQPYQGVVDSFRRAVVGDDEERSKPGHEVAVRTAGEVGVEELEGADVLVLGEAVRQPQVREFLARTRSPVRWTDDGFVVDGEEYRAPGQAVFFTVHHPARPEDGVTVYYGNSTAALANARLLTYYPNSLLVFETPLDEADGGDATPTGMPRTRVVRRADFEFHDRIDLGAARP